MGTDAQSIASPLPSVRTTSVHAFVDSIGLNAQLSYDYYPPITTVQPLISGLGIRHLRVSAGVVLTNPRYVGELASLNTALGVHFDVLTNLYLSATQVEAAIALLPSGSVDSVEGPNETDNPGQGIYYDPNFAADVPPYVEALYKTIKETAQTRQLTVIGPSFVNAASYAAIGNISQFVDSGNMHNYFAGFNPGTYGWGGNGYTFAPSLYYGSILWNMAAAAQATGSKPITATETGYSTAPIKNAVPNDIQAKYIPRMFLEQYRKNVKRTYLYQLIGYDDTTMDGSLSIVNTDATPKAAYYSLAGMVSILDDDNNSTAGAVVPFAVTGITKSVDHVVLSKADGTIFAAVWIETSSYDVNANGGFGQRINVPSQAVHLRFASSLNKTGSIWTADVNGKWTSNPIPFVNGVAALSAQDSVSLVVLKP